MLRKKGVVGRFVEFYGPGLAELALADRATIGNMAPEYGATCGFFPIDAETMRYLDAHRPRAAAQVKLVEAYAKAQGLWRDDASPDPVFTDTLELDLGSGRAVPGRAAPAAGPRGALGRGRSPSRPSCRKLAANRAPAKTGGAGARSRAPITSSGRRRGDRRHHHLHQHLQSERDARRRPARAQRGEARPEGQALGQDLAGAGQPGGHRLSTPPPACSSDLDKLGFNLVGYGCTTCIGNSGPLPEPIAEAIDEGRSRGRRGALGQPQFRGPRPSLCARQLSGLAAAGGGLCAGRLDEASISPRSRSARTATASRSISRTSGPSNQEIAATPSRKAVDAGDVPQALCQRLRRAGGVAEGRSSSAA